MNEKKIPTHFIELFILSILSKRYKPAIVNVYEYTKILEIIFTFKLVINRMEIRIGNKQKPTLIKNQLKYISNRIIFRI